MANSAPPPAAGDPDGLALVLGQIGRISRRVNLLAGQHLIFSSLALLIGAGGLLVLAACWFSPSAFLVTAIILAAAVLVGLPLAIALSLRRFSSFEGTVALADERAELKGRLTTLVGRGGRDRRHPLWPYLMEDTLSRLDDFEPRRIERRRLSPAFYCLLAACLIAGFAAFTSYVTRKQEHEMRLALNGGTFDIDPSQIRPGNNGGPQAEIVGNPAQLRALAQRLNRAGKNTSALGKIGQTAQNMASSLQDKLTGRDRPDQGKMIKMRLAHELDNNDTSQDQNSPENQGGGNSGGTKQRPGQLADNNQQSLIQQGPQAGAAGSNAPSGPRPGTPDNSTAQSPGGGSSATTPPGPLASLGMKPLGSNQGNESLSSPGGPIPHSGRDSGGGATAGGGSDPSGLLGPPDAPAGHVSNNFQITIDARLTADSKIRGGQAYTPARINLSLNQRQHADQPLVRAVIPAADRETIRRVFER